MKSIMELKELATNGDLGAITDLGNYYHKNAEKGMAGYPYNVDNNLSRAEEWYLKAAEKADPEWQFNLGAFYWHYDDIEKATLWYTKAAEQGHAEAKRQLFLLEENLK